MKYPNILLAESHSDIASNAQKLKKNSISHRLKNIICVSMNRRFPRRFLFISTYNFFVCLLRSYPCSQNDVIVITKQGYLLRTHLKNILFPSVCAHYRGGPSQQYVWPLENIDFEKKTLARKSTKTERFFRPKLNEPVVM